MARDCFGASSYIVPVIVTVAGPCVYSTVNLNVFGSSVVLVAMIATEFGPTLSGWPNWMPPFCSGGAIVALGPALAAGSAFASAFGAAVGAPAAGFSADGFAAAGVAAATWAVGAGAGATCVVAGPVHATSMGTSGTMIQRRMGISVVS